MQFMQLTVMCENGFFFQLANFKLPHVVQILESDPLFFLPGKAQTLELNTERKCWKEA